MSAPTGSRKLSAAMRELVAGHFSAEGFDAAPTRPYARISDGIGQIGTPDVTGVPGVWVDVPARGSHRLSWDLDSAQSDAATAGYDMAVVIAHRPGRMISEAFAVMSLRDFSALARAAQPSP